MRSNLYKSAARVTGGAGNPNEMMPIKRRCIKEACHIAHSKEMKESAV
jgi:hypothetical protein